MRKPKAPKNKNHTQKPTLIEITTVRRITIPSRRLCYTAGPGSNSGIWWDGTGTVRWTIPPNPPLYTSAVYRWELGTIPKTAKEEGHDGNFQINDMEHAQPPSRIPTIYNTQRSGTLQPTQGEQRTAIMNSFTSHGFGTVWLTHRLGTVLSANAFGTTWPTDRFGQHFQKHKMLNKNIKTFSIVPEGTNEPSITCLCLAPVAYKRELLWRPQKG